jgi:hypothetical protein
MRRLESGRFIMLSRQESAAALERWYVHGKID